MARKRRYTDEQIIDALKQTQGMVFLAADVVGCNADTIYERAKVSPAVAGCLRHQRGRVVDAAELVLMNAIHDKQGWAVQFALRTLGKDRGYVERTEVVQPEAVKVRIVEEIVEAAPPGPAPSPGRPEPE